MAWKRFEKRRRQKRPTNRFRKMQKSQEICFECSLPGVFCVSWSFSQHKKPRMEKKHTHTTNNKTEQYTTYLMRNFNSYARSFAWLLHSMWMQTVQTVQTLRIFNMYLYTLYVRHVTRTYLFVDFVFSPSSFRYLFSTIFYCISVISVCVCSCFILFCVRFSPFSLCL